MKHKKITITFSIFIIITIIFLILFYTNKKEKSFYRVEKKNLIQDTQHFRVDQSRRRIYFKKEKQETVVEGIPSINGTYFYLKGKKQVVIPPRLTGAISIYTYLLFKSHKKDRVIDFSLVLNRKGKDLEITRIAAAKVKQPLFQDFTLKKGDLILLRFRGRGIIYFSQPIIYKKYQKQTTSQCKHIFFIGVDTLRGDHIGRKINGQSITPAMDRFKEDAVYFENAYAQTSWTLPSFMSLFTGLYEFNHGVGIKSSLDRKKPFLVENLNRNFVTFAYHGGKVMDSRWGFSRGFDYYKKFQPAAALYPKGGRSLFQKAIELLEQSRFPNLFLFLHTYQVHAPYTPPHEFLKQLNQNPNYFKLDPVNYSEPAKTYIPVEDKVRDSLKELYQAEILAFDNYFGEFIIKLKEMNLYKNAMIILMSDHGEEFYEHRGWAHSHSLYDEAIHVPVFVKFPGNRYKNTIAKSPIGLIDIFPTILNYYDIPYEQRKIDGIDLMPLLDKKTPEIQRNHLISTISNSKYFEAFSTKISLRFGDYKLIYNAPYRKEDMESFKPYTLPPQVPGFELYNIEKDPGEIHNITASHPKIKEEMVPLILKIKKLIQKNSFKDKGKNLDQEVKKQLESLGYL